MGERFPNWRFAQDPEAERRQQLEDEGTAMLKERRLFRSGTGLRSPRSMLESRQGWVEWNEDTDDRIAELGAVDAWEEMDLLARRARLTPLQKAVISLSRLEEFSLREIQALLGVPTLYQVEKAFNLARRKLESLYQRTHGDPFSARVLYYEEIRQKRACTYRAPRRGLPRRRRHRRSCG